VHARLKNQKFVICHGSELFLGNISISLFLTGCCKKMLARGKVGGSPACVREIGADSQKDSRGLLAILGHTMDNIVCLLSTNIRALSHWPVSS